MIISPELDKILSVHSSEASGFRVELDGKWINCHGNITFSTKGGAKNSLNRHYSSIIWYQCQTLNDLGLKVTYENRDEIAKQIVEELMKSGRLKIVAL